MAKRTDKSGDFRRKMTLLLLSLADSRLSGSAATADDSKLYQSVMTKEKELTQQKSLELQMISELNIELKLSRCQS